MMRRALASCLCVVTCVAIATSPLGATAFAMRHVDAPAQPGPPTPADAAATARPGPPTPAEPTLAEQPGPPTPAEPTPAEPPAAEPPVPPAAEHEPSLVHERTGVIVHIVNALPDEDRGRLKLARYRGTETSRTANLIVYTTKYEELCTEPCGVPLDLEDRPILFFVRDEAAVSHGFRLGDDAGEVTLLVRPQRRGMLMSGLYLSSLFLFPVTIPLIILGRSTVALAPGAPSPTQEFRRLKKSRA